MAAIYGVNTASTLKKKKIIPHENFVILGNNVIAIVLNI